MNRKVKIKLRAHYPENNLEFLKIQYQVLSDQQLNHNSIIWNMPSLVFVAQSFLWGISLDGDIELILRCIISFISILVIFVSLQQFSRNRLMEIADSEQLYSIEKKISENLEKKGKYLVLMVHHRLSERTIYEGRTQISLLEKLEDNKFYQRTKISHLRTYYLWNFVFWIFLLVSILIFLYNFLHAIRIYWIC